jgi:tetratricopeptide (TPR) repeat protein
VVLVSTRALRVSEARAGPAVALVAGLATYLFHAGVDWMWELTAATVYALAIGAALVHAGPRAEFESHGFPSPLAAIAVIAALGGALVQLPSTASTSNVRKSQNAVRGGNLPAAMAYANDAVAAEPWAATSYTQRALVNEAIGALAFADADLRRAVSAEPTNWRPALLLARVLAEEGRPRLALETYRRAATLRPLSALFRPR